MKNAGICWTFAFIFLFLVGGCSRNDGGSASGITLRQAILPEAQDLIDRYKAEGETGLSKLSQGLENESAMVRQATVSAIQKFETVPVEFSDHLVKLALSKKGHGAKEAIVLLTKFGSTEQLGQLEPLLRSDKDYIALEAAIMFKSRRIIEVLNSNREAVAALCSSGSREVGRKAAELIKQIAPSDDQWIEPIGRSYLSTPDVGIGQNLAEALALYKEKCIPLMVDALKKGYHLKVTADVLRSLGPAASPALEPLIRAKQSASAKHQERMRNLAHDVYNRTSTTTKTLTNGRGEVLSQSRSGYSGPSDLRSRMEASGLSGTIASTSSAHESIMDAIDAAITSIKATKGGTEPWSDFDSIFSDARRVKVALSTNGILLAASSQGPNARIHVWNTRTRKLLKSNSYESIEIERIAFSADARSVAIFEKLISAKTRRAFVKRFDWVEGEMASVAPSAVVIAEDKSSVTTEILGNTVSATDIDDANSQFWQLSEPPLKVIASAKGETIAVVSGKEILVARRKASTIGGKPIANRPPVVRILPQTVPKELWDGQEVHAKIQVNDPETQLTFAEARTNTNAWQKVKGDEFIFVARNDISSISFRAMDIDDAESEILTIPIKVRSWKRIRTLTTRNSSSSESEKMDDSLTSPDAPRIPFAISSSGWHFAVGGENNRIDVWDVRRDAPIRTLEHLQPPNSIAFGNDGKLLAATSEKTLMIWDLHEDKVIYSPDAKLIKFDADKAAGKSVTRPKNALKYTHNRPFAVLFDQDNQFLVADAYAIKKKQPTMGIRNSRSKSRNDKDPTKLTFGRADKDDVVLRSPTENVLASLDKSFSRIAITSCRTGKLLFQIRILYDPEIPRIRTRGLKPRATGMSWSTDGKSIYCVGDFGLIKMDSLEYNEDSVKTKDVFVSLDAQSRPADVEANFSQVRNSKSGKLVSVCTDRGVLELWDGEASSRRSVITPKVPIQDATVVANDRGIVTLHSDGSLGLWKLEIADTTSANRTK